MLLPSIYSILYRVLGFWHQCFLTSRLYCILYNGDCPQTRCLKGAPNATCAGWSLDRTPNTSVQPQDPIPYAVLQHLTPCSVLPGPCRVATEQQPPHLLAGEASFSVPHYCLGPPSLNEKRTHRRALACMLTSTQGHSRGPKQEGFQRHLGSLSPAGPVVTATQQCSMVHMGLMC